MNDQEAKHRDSRINWLIIQAVLREGMEHLGFRCEKPAVFENPSVFWKEGVGTWTFNLWRHWHEDWWCLTAEVGDASIQALIIISEPNLNKETNKVSEWLQLLWQEFQRNME